MPRGLAGKTVIVTGAASGIGRASAEHLAANGCNVVVVDLDGDKALEVAATLPSAVGVGADVATQEGTDRYVDAALEAFGQLDLMHANAGIVHDEVHLADMDFALWDRVHGVNFRAMALGVSRMMRELRAAGRPGAIVLTGSIGAERAFYANTPYETSKAAVLALARGASRDGGPLGIRVNAVSPGATATEMQRAIILQEMERDGEDMSLHWRDSEAAKVKDVALDRLAEPSEIASVVAWLLSAEASFVTGVNVRADGGLLA